jgi:hypothetical protein
MPIPLRSDFDGTALRQFARRSKNGSQARRLLLISNMYQGLTVIR